MVTGRASSMGARKTLEPASMRSTVRSSKGNLVLRKLGKQVFYTTMEMCTPSLAPLKVLCVQRGGNVQNRNDLKIFEVNFSL